MLRYSLLIIFCLTLLFSCKKKEKHMEPASPRPVKVAQVQALGQITRQYTGVVQATEFSILAFKVSGTLTELNITEGQYVNKGEILARINPDDYQLDYQTSESNYNAARSIYERNKRLYASNATARQDMEIAEADYIQATSAVNIARRTLDYSILTAPFRGFIEKKFVGNYEEVLAGQAIVRLVNPNNIEIKITLPETGIQLIKIPKKVYVEFDSHKGKLFTSEIKEYVYASDGSGIPVTLNITDKAFEPYRQSVFPGFSCKVIFETDLKIADNYYIPASAIIQEGTNEYVWVVNPQDKTVHKQKITTFTINDAALVKEGLDSDDFIVTAGASSLKEGQKVRLLQTD